MLLIQPWDSAASLSFYNLNRWLIDSFTAIILDVNDKFMYT